MSEPENAGIDSDDARISQLIDAAADGLDVDWAAAVADFVQPAEREVVEQLSTLALLAKMFRILGNESPASGSSTTARSQAVRGSQPAGADVPAPAAVDKWGPLSILARLGSGSFGTVYRAWEAGLEREVALKLLHKVHTNAEKVVVDEARLLARIRHPNVVTIFGADCFDGRIGFWMELVSGRTLSQLYQTTGASALRRRFCLASTCAAPLPRSIRPGSSTAT